MKYKGVRRECLLLDIGLRGLMRIAPIIEYNRYISICSSYKTHKNLIFNLWKLKNS